jgi:hypothetical protein
MPVLEQLSEDDRTASRSAVFHPADGEPHPYVELGGSRVYVYTYGDVLVVVVDPAEAVKVAVRVNEVPVHGEPPRASGRPAGRHRVRDDAGPSAPPGGSSGPGPPA